MKGCSRGIAGPNPFSEPETQAYRDFVLRHRIRVALTYHEHRLESVTIKDGGGGRSEPFAKQIANVLGYPYQCCWTEYPLTGQAQDWLDSIGVIGAEIELKHRSLDRRPDWSANIEAMKLAIRQASSI
jgi:hypothetical protein